MHNGLKNLRVVHLAMTPVAGSPWNIVEALNKHTKVAARLVVLNPDAYGKRTFKNDLIWENDKEESLAELEAADVVHIHQWFDPGGWFGPEVGAICAEKACVRQFHSMPEHFVGNDATAVARILNDPLPQLVIAQFQERYYPRARIVPNIIPLHEQYLLPTDSTNNDLPRISWSPSVREPAWTSRWITKGYPETLRLLCQLKNENHCVLDVIENTAHDECLMRKQTADLVVDDLVTGSYHLSGLEGLAQGKPVLGWLDDRTQAVLRELTGTNTLPWVNVHLEDAERVLRALLSDTDLRKALGAQSRAWMERWYSDRTLSAHYERVYYDLLERPDLLARSDDRDAVAHWRNVQLPDLMWEARRSRALLAETTTWQAKIRKKWKAMFKQIQAST